MKEVLLSDGNEKSIQSILSSSPLLLFVYRFISVSFLWLTFIYMHSYGFVSVNSFVFFIGVSIRTFVRFPVHENHMINLCYRLHDICDFQIF